MDHNPYSSPGVAPDLSPLKSLYSLARIFIALIVIGVVAALLMPPVSRGRVAARRTQCKNNLKQIGMALANYHDTYGSFPPAYTVDADGRPLHSWRTLLLPQLDRADLYSKIDLSKPWDDLVNQEVFRQNPLQYSCYQCPSSANSGEFTSYVAIVSDQGCFAPGKVVRYSDINDGSSNTLLIVEVSGNRSIPWMSTEDADESLLANMNAKQKFHHTGGFHALLADGSVRFLSANTDKTTLHSLVTRDANDVPGDF